MANLFEADQNLAAVVGYAGVAPEQGIDPGSNGLTYAIPSQLADLSIGERVVVPLGRSNKPVTGYVISISDSTNLEPAKLKSVMSRDETRVCLTHDLVELAQWMAGYYCCPLGMVFSTMLPAAVKHRTGMTLQALVSPVPQVMEQFSGRLSRLQRHVLEKADEQVNESGREWIDMKCLADLAGARTVSPLKQLVDKGLLRIKRVEKVVSDFDLHAEQTADGDKPHVLNAEQQQAVDHLIKHIHNGFGVHLLHGVTGSGKTEVYLQLIKHLIHRGDGRQDPGGPGDPGVIVLVPEISLTPQTAGRFIARFNSVAVLHSGLTESQRHAQWRRIRTREARIVVGARSAVFAPVPDLELIIVDEEHDSSYKQDQLPRYNGRDVAIKRAQLSGKPVILGSATPSLESYYNATSGNHAAYHLVELSQRVTGLNLPEVEIVDMQDERKNRYAWSGKSGFHLFSMRLETALRQTLQSGGQVILLLNRRGYGQYITCSNHRCGWLMSCEHCDVMMVYHKHNKLPAGGFVRCHHCHTEQLLPRHCPICGKMVSVFGLGTQRIEEELSAKFPQATYVRMDSDTMRSGRDYRVALDQFRSGQVDILLGTQMIAKGLDFPNVRLVGIISGDTALNMPDFRAGERTFQLIAQVAGRAGRSHHSGRVILQTFSPNDTSICLAAGHDYVTFAQQELALRDDVGLPPVTRMARIVIRDKDYQVCHNRAAQLHALLERLNEVQGGDIRLLGPMPCPIARIADYYRLQIELITSPHLPRGKAAVVLQKLLAAARNTKALISDALTAVDVDPVSLL